jgi:hypothetical protein
VRGSVNLKERGTRFADRAFLFSDAVTTNAEVGGQAFFAIIPPSFQKWLAKLSDFGEAREVQ